jgi:hypothetical protein
MEHIKSSFYFTSKGDNWQVDYIGSGITVYLNNELYWDFKSKPYTKTENPTKSQGAEIISISKKLYKEKYKLRDNRDKVLTKLGID